MKDTFTRVVSGLLLAALPAAGGAIVFESTGNLAAVTTTRDSFRTAIGGGTVAGANGSFGGVRREINWDGVPDGLSAPNNLPANFFNVNSPRGVVFSTPGTGFQVSANSGVAPIQFDNINAGYSANFEPFSAQRLFTALGSTITDVNFFIPGSATASTTSAFGVVFSDVDLANTSQIQFFDQNNNPLFSRFVLNTLGNESFSFLGVSFNAGEKIGRVRITSGNLVLGAGVNENPTQTLAPPTDLVVMDDFIFAETATPEPSTLMLSLLGLLSIPIAKKFRL